ncbi:hypothetical protein RJ640_012401 [Escallonia rubra]|uniref:DUF4283 domain-containing protein n=1 Tax=Escallonia rubra TaxID=112253 RepID=A0AA88U911_9ASTE|nr:hypothetical protein RJ640_012401 [Escallonia rubra]
MSSTENSFNLEEPLALERNGHMVFVPPELSSANQLRWQRTLVGRFADDRVFTCSFVQAMVDQFWTLTGATEVEAVGDYFAFHFSADCDLDCIISHGPWNMNGALLVVAHWHQFSCIPRLDFSTVNLWVRLHDIPAELFLYEVAEQLGAHFGEVLEVDWSERRRVRRDYLRVKVRVSISDPLVTGVYIPTIPEHSNGGSPDSVDSNVGSNISATDPDSGESSGTSATTFYSCAESPVSPVPVLLEISAGSPENLPSATVVPLPDVAAVGSPEVPRFHCATNTCLAAASPPNHGNDICSLTPSLDPHAAYFVAPDQLEDVVGGPSQSLGEQWAQYIFGPKSVKLNLSIDGPYPSFPPKPRPHSSTRPHTPDPAACPASSGGLALDQYGTNLASSLSQLAVTGQACPHPPASALLEPSAAHPPESGSQTAQLSPAFVMRIPSETEFQLEDDPLLQSCLTVGAHLRPPLLLLSSTTSVASPESNSSTTNSGKRTRDLDSDLLVILPAVKKTKSGAILQVEADLVTFTSSSDSFSSGSRKRSSSHTEIPSASFSLKRTRTYSTEALPRPPGMCLHPQSILQCQMPG